MRGQVLLIIGACTFLACGTGEDGDVREPADGGTLARADAEPGVDLGVTLTSTVIAGAGRDRYEPLANGQAVELVAGPQGGGRLYGYHVWSGVRVVGFQPVGATVQIEILSAATGARRAEQTRVIPLEPNAGGHVAYGIAPRIDDCCLAANSELILRATVTDSTGQSGRSERRVLAGGCLNAQGASICP